MAKRKKKLIPLFPGVLQDENPSQLTGEVSNSEQPNVYDLLGIYVGAVLGGDKNLVDQVLDYLRYFDSTPIQPFVELLNSDSPYIREAGVNALEILGDYTVLTTLEKSLHDTNSHVRQAAVRAIGEIGDVTDLNNIIILLNDVNPFVREEAAITLGKGCCDKATQPLIDCLQDENIHVTLAAIKAISLIGDYRGIKPLLTMLNHPSDSVTIAVGEAICEIKDFDLQPFYEAVENVSVPIDQALIEAYHNLDIDGITRILVDTLKAGTPAGKRAAGAVLTAVREFINVEQLVERLIGDLHDEDPSVRAAAANSLGDISDKGAVDQLIQLLGDENEDVRVAAIRALGSFEDIKASEALLEMTQDSSPEVRKASITVLGNIGDMTTVSVFSNIDDDSRAVRKAIDKAISKIQRRISKK